MALPSGLNVAVIASFFYSAINHTTNMQHSVKVNLAQSAHLANSIASIFSKFPPAELVEYVGEMNSIVLEQIEDDGTPVFEAETLLEFHQKGNAIATLLCNLAQVYGVPCDATEAATPEKQPLEA